MKTDVVQAYFSFTIPDKKWLYTFSRKFSNLDFCILSLLPLSNSRANCLLQIKGSGYSVFLAEFIHFYKGDQFIVLHKSSNYLLINVKMKNPWFLQRIIEADLILHYPIRISNGCLNVELIAERDKIDQLFTQFDENNIEYTLIHIGQYSITPVLTPKQEKVLIKLVDDGYYEIPRRYSLSTIAKKLQVSPTSLSEMIRRISRNLSLYYLKRKEKK
jgi:hypothetical protein